MPTRGGGSSAGTAFITILPDTDKFVASLVTQMKGAGAAADKAGNEAIVSSLHWDTLKDAMKDAGTTAAMSSADYRVLSAGVGSAGGEALSSSFNWNVLDTAIGDAAATATTSTAGYIALGASADYAAEQASELNRALAAGVLLRGGGIFGGPPGKGIATDLGSAFRDLSNMAQAFVGILTTIAPTINVIIAALVGVISLLGVGIIAAAAFATALAATGTAMAFAAFKWRDLMTQANEGAETWRGALLAIEAQAFNMAQGVVKSFSSMGDSGSDMWTKIAEAGVAGLQKMQPVIDWIVEHVTNFINAMNGEAGATSPFLEFMRTWLAEWKVLGQIINQGIEGGGGLLGFFEKYEKPAKAFVEGIAQVINSLRKMSAMGLGLNMDQLAEFIRNVFTALSQLIEVFPRFSNSLVTVGLEVTRFILAIMPIVQNAILIGSAILEHIVAPLVNFLLVALEKVMNLPIINFLASLAGAFVLLGYTISRLSLSRITFAQLMQGMIGYLIALSQRIGLTILSLFSLQAATISAWSTLAGGVVILAVVAAAYLALRGPMQTVGQMSKDVANTFDEAWAQMVAGAKTGSEVLAETYNQSAESFNQLSNLEKIVYGVVNFGDSLRAVFLGTSTSALLTQDALDKMREAYGKLSDELSGAVLTGLYSPEQEQALASLRADYLDFQNILENGVEVPPGGLGEDALAAWEADIERMKIGADTWMAKLTEVNDAYGKGLINAGQYATMLTQLYGTQRAAAEEYDIAALKIEGASNTIAEAMIQVQKNSVTATGGLEQFALSSGQAFVGLKDEAVKAMTDIAGGLLGTGAKVTEFFQKQAAAIEQWKTDTADAFNFVKTAFADLADGSAVSFNEIKTTLQGAVQDLKDYTKNWDTLVKLDASRELLRQVKDLGQGGAEVLAGLVEGGRKGVREINKLIKSGMTLSEALAVNMADALGVTMDKLVLSIEVMISELLGIPFNQVRERVDRLYDHWNNREFEAKKLKVDIQMTQAAGKMMREGILPTPKVKGGGLGIVPPPDTNAIKAAYVTAGAAAIEGFTAGANDNAAAVAAAKAIGEEAVKATRAAIGAQSPATEFTAIGKDAIAGLLIGLSSGSSQLVSKAYNIGIAIGHGLRNGLLVGLGDAKAAMVQAAYDMIDAVRSIIGAFSPSRVFYEIGQDITDGLRIGIDEGMRQVRDDMSAYAADTATVFDAVQPSRPNALLSAVGGSRRIAQEPQIVSIAPQPSQLEGTMRITDWRLGIASLDAELAWEDAVKTR